MPRTLKKLRPDSKFARLSEEQRAAFDALLCEDEHTLADLQEWLAGQGVEVSQQSISEYYKNHVLPFRWILREQTADRLEKVGGRKSAGAARAAMAQMVFDLSTDANADPKLLEKFFRLMLASERLEHNDRRLKLLEERAKQAEAAKKVTANKKLTKEEKEARYKKIFGMN